jgi:hypothetical protein
MSEEEEEQKFIEEMKEVENLINRLMDALRSKDMTVEDLLRVFPFLFCILTRDMDRDSFRMMVKDFVATIKAVRPIVKDMEVKIIEVGEKKDEESN